MNSIVMIPVEQLHHHPENPRLDLGDLTELTESIRQNGVMQNLTVVPGHFMTKAEWVKEARAEGADRTAAEDSYRLADAYVSDGYTVVIGNRRMEASKRAGLTELPCVISDMDHRTQISTMLMENMQRADLTVYEQAQGFQMMMDLGFKANEIAEKTGFGETTVRRRLKLAEMDPKLLKKACEAKDTERQITLYDFERLAQVRSLKERNALLKEIGDSGFGWKVKQTLKRQKAQDVKPTVREILKGAGAKEIKQDERYSSEYDNHYEWKVDLSEWKPGNPKIIPETEEKLFWYMDEDTLYLFTKRKKAPAEKKTEKSPEEIEREKQIAEAWKQLTADEKTAKELRAEFVKDLGVNTKNAMWMFQWFLMAVTLTEVMYKGPRDELMELIGVPKNVAWDDRIPKSVDGVLGLGAGDYPKVILEFFEAVNVDSFHYGNFKGQKPVFRKCRTMDLMYEWLCSLGYSMSETEMAMQDGTHPAYMEEKA